MSKTTYTQWKCEHCGHEERSTLSGIPIGWFHVVQRVLCANDRVGELCSGLCVTRWLTELPVVSR
jgi:hypothetical protein